MKSVLRRIVPLCVVCCLLLCLCGQTVFAGQMYTVRYFVGTTLVHTDVYRVGETIEPYDYYVPIGYDFSGWQPELPETMPEEHLIIRGAVALEGMPYLWQDLPPEATEEPEPIEAPTEEIRTQAATASTEADTTVPTEAPQSSAPATVATGGRTTAALGVTVLALFAVAVTLPRRKKTF